MSEEISLEKAVAEFGKESKKKLDSAAVSGSPEDQLRTPLEHLIRNIASLTGLPEDAVLLVGETALKDLQTRPDYAVRVYDTLVGFIEIKAPGKGADPRKFVNPHDQEQWRKLQTLPNLIYTDGNAFSLWQDGELAENIVHLDGDVETSGKNLKAPERLVSLFSAFLQWQPYVPNNAEELAELSARLCRLIREEVTEELGQGSHALTSLAADWRRLLFPEATDAAFADGYAQAVTFGLLMARAREIELAKGLDRVAKELRDTNTLIGTALRLLTDEGGDDAPLQTSLRTLTRVLDAVHWPTISKGQPEAWLYFYEQFLRVYDNSLRKRTGSYYTPPQVVDAMVRLVDEGLQAGDRFNLANGLADQRVNVIDPGTGTGTFLLGVLRQIAENIEADEGAGAVAAGVEAAMPRLIGFERQFGPFAVAQLRLLAELQEYLTPSAQLAKSLRLFVTDTLANPYAEEEWIPRVLEPLAESRRQANAIKRDEPITVVIGNPPYRERAKGLGGWVELGDPNRAAILKDWQPPSAWGVGAHAKHLRNLYVYFWRWAVWKVFQDADAIRFENKTPDRKGVVSFITVAGFLNGPGFQKMRSDLRRDADAIWVIDCSPEGHQPPVQTRIFEDVQQPVCIVLAMRHTDEGSSAPAAVRYQCLPEADRLTKFDALADIQLDGAGWEPCPGEWRAPFLPVAHGAWRDFVPLENIFDYYGSGVMPGRVWVIAPDIDTLERRWNALQRETDRERRQHLFRPHLVNGQPGDKHAERVPSRGLPGQEFRKVSVASDKGDVLPPVRYGFRSFDRKYVIPDNRLLNRPNPTLWSCWSKEQIFLTAPHDRSPSNGPALTFSNLIPDIHHYHGRGGRVFPLWADGDATRPNVNVPLLNVSSDVLETSLAARDVLAYIAAVAAHPGYTERFQEELTQPGLRIPVTADPDLFWEAVAVGRDVIWLHTFGERYVDQKLNRPNRPPRVSPEKQPYIPKGADIPKEPGRMPNEITYDAAERRLYVGEGYVDNVAPGVWAYEVSGMRVLTQWFSYRRRDRSRPLIGERRPPSPLNDIQSDRWLAEYTSELLNVLNVLTWLVELEPTQADLLDRICSGQLLSAEWLRSEGAFDGGGPSASGGDDRQGHLSM